jgi:hypothetical protein
MMMDLLSITAVTPFLAFSLFAGLVCMALAASALWILPTKKAALKESPSPPSTERSKSKDTKNRETFACPFSAETSFVVETAEHLEDTPLDCYGDWEDHLAARWLAAGLSGQETPGMLRMGLKRLRNSKHFLVETASQIKEELLMKKRALDDPARHDIVYVQEESSIPAQSELLELFMAYLPKRYPDIYSYNVQEKSVTVHPLDTTFRLDDWKHAPLELCERIVQEDLILMRPGKSASDSGKLAPEGYYMAAAAVVFSFDELPEKLGQPAEFLHAPVPGYERHLRKGLNMFFNKLKVEQPMWRNNWGIAPSGTLDKPIYGSTSALEHRNMGNVTRADVRAKFLKVEYETIRRLPRSGYLLFTVRSFANPITCLEEVPPTAAACLAASIRGMSPAMQAYKGIENEATSDAVLSYLDAISGKVGALSDKAKSPEEKKEE